MRVYMSTRLVAAFAGQGALNAAWLHVPKDNDGWAHYRSTYGEETASLAREMIATEVAGSRRTRFELSDNGAVRLAEIVRLEILDVGDLLGDDERDDRRELRGLLRSLRTVAANTVAANLETKIGDPS